MLQILVLIKIDIEIAECDTVAEVLVAVATVTSWTLAYINCENILYHCEIEDFQVLESKTLERCKLVECNIVPLILIIFFLSQCLGGGYERASSVPNRR